MLAGAGDGEVPQRFGDYTRAQELGRGGYAVVFACKKASSRECLAAKAFDLRRLRTAANAAREIKKLQREASILKQVPAHPNLVRFVDIVQEGSAWLFFVMELVDGGDLMKTMLKRPGKRPRLNDQESLFVFRQLIEGLGWLHSQGVIHRDLKLENVLVVRERVHGSCLFVDVKITDFGLSRFVGPEFSEPRSTVGSPRYMAPEVKAIGTHHLPCDFWSLGILLSILLGGRFPCDGLPHVSQAKLDEAVKKLPASVHAQSVVSGLLQLRPEDRMTIEQLRRHVWLTSGSKHVAEDPPDGHAPQAREAKRPRIRTKSREEDRLWTNEDNKKFTSAIAEVTSVMREEEEEAKPEGKPEGKPGAASSNGAAAKAATRPGAQRGRGKAGAAAKRGAARGKAAAKRGVGRGSGRGRGGGRAAAAAAKA